MRKNKSNRKFITILLHIALNLLLVSPVIHEFTAPLDVYAAGKELGRARFSGSIGTHPKTIQKHTGRGNGLKTTTTDGNSVLKYIM